MLAEFMLKMAARPLIPSLPIEFPLARAKFKLCRERRNHYSERFKTRFRMPALYDSRRWSNCLVRRNITEEGSRRLQSGEIPRLPVPFLGILYRRIGAIGEDINYRRYSPWVRPDCCDFAYGPASDVHQNRHGLNPVYDYYRPYVCEHYLFDHLCHTGNGSLQVPTASSLTSLKIQD